MLQEELAKIERERQEEEAKEREQKAIIGTYYFSASNDNKEWTERLVVMEDYRVIKHEQSSKIFVGTVNEVSNGVFTVKMNRDGEGIGAWCTLYKNGEIIGRLGWKGYHFPNTFVVVVDTNTRRIYKNVESYNNKDISDVEYIMYDRFSSVIE